MNEANMPEQVKQNTIEIIALSLRNLDKKVDAIGSQVGVLTNRVMGDGDRSLMTRLALLEERRERDRMQIEANERATNAAVKAAETADGKTRGRLRDLESMQIGKRLAAVEAQADENTAFRYKLLGAAGGLAFLGGGIGSVLFNIVAQAVAGAP